MKVSARARTHAVRPLPLVDVLASRCGSTSSTSTNELGWKPQYSTDEMLAESYDWFVSHRADTDRDDVSHHRRTARSGILCSGEARSRRPFRRGVTGVDRLAGGSESLFDAHQRVRPCSARLRAGTCVVAGTDASGHQALPVPRPWSAHVGRAVDDRRPAVRWVGPPPAHHVPVALRSVVLVLRQGRRSRLGRPPAVARHAVLRSGLGVRWLARLLGIGVPGALVAALVYQLSPYVLPYVSRTSLMLAPWAGLPWIVGLTARAAVRGRWRDVAIIALIIATVGSPNATALAMVAPAPVLWLVHAAWARSISWRRAAVTARQDRGSRALRLAVVDRHARRAGPVRRRCPRLLRVARGGLVHLQLVGGAAWARLLALLPPRRVCGYHQRVEGLPHVRHR